MAVSAIKVTLGVDLGEGKFNSKISYPADPVAALATAKTNSTAIVTAAAAYVTAAATFAAALAVLVADAASPTQAHVTTANTAYTALAAAYTTLAAAITASDTTTQAASLAGDLVMLVDTAAITTSNGVNAAVRKALRAAENIGIVKP